MAHTSARDSGVGQSATTRSKPSPADYAPVRHKQHSLANVSPEQSDTTGSSELVCLLCCEPIKVTCGPAAIDFLEISV